MKTTYYRYLITLTFALTLFAWSATAALYTQTYEGNNVSPSSAVVSQGTLTMSGNVGANIGVTFTRGGSDGTTMGNYLVLFLDSTAGGFNNTASFTDSALGSPAAISGYNGSIRTVATFAAGFYADYAVVINPDAGVRLYRLGTSDLELMSLLRGPGSGSDRTYTFSLSRSDLGLSGTDALRFQSAYSTQFGSRTLESFETMTGSPGWNPVSYNYFNVFDVQAVPEMTNVALPIFGGLVVLVGVGARLRRYWAAAKV